MGALAGVAAVPGAMGVMAVGTMAFLSARVSMKMLNWSWCGVLCLWVFLWKSKTTNQIIPRFFSFIVLLC